MAALVPTAVRSVLRTPSRWWPTTQLAVTAAMPTVLAAGWVAADFVQPHGYSPVRQTISVAAGHAGAHRWVGTVALLALGVGFVLCTALLPGLSPFGRAGILATGVCGLGVALCPEAAGGPTSSHEVFSVLGALLLVLGPLFTRRAGTADEGVPWTQRTAGAVCGVAVFFVLTAWLVAELNLSDAAGLAERVATTVEVSWPLLVVLSARRSAQRR